MKWFNTVIDFVLIRIVWTCYVLFNTMLSRKNKESLDSERKHLGPHDKRHFIHLYTTTSPSGTPECYMDVYEMNSPTEEKILRDVCSKGIPNSTYWKCRGDTQKEKYVPKAWLGYSTIAM